MAGPRDPLDRKSIRAYLRALPRKARRKLCLDSVDGFPSAVCALLPWLTPPLTTALAVLAAVRFRWPDAAATSIVLGAFFLGIVLAFRLVRAIELAVTCSRLRSLESGRLPVCPLCSYSQRGTDGDRCSECGWPVRIVRGGILSEP